jgi:hypothetical protein
MRTLIAFVLILGTCIMAMAQQPSENVMTPFGQQRGTGQGNRGGDTAGNGTALQPPCADCPTKVFSLRYVDSRAIANLLKPFEVNYSVEPGLKTVTVKAPEKTLNAIEEVIKRFDVPANTPKQVEVTAYLLLGSSEPGPDTMPAGLKPVVDQLRAVMAYKSYRVLDTIMAIGKEGDYLSEVSLTPQISETDPPHQYTFSATPRVITGEGAERSIHFDTLQLSFTNGGSIRTSVDIKKGQQVVIGKTTVKDRAIILVLSAKIID